MSYSFREPEEPAICECKYDEMRDRMDREDCPFHCDLLEDTREMEALCTERKRPTVGANVGDAGNRRPKIA